MVKLKVGKRFSKTDSYLERLKELGHASFLDMYGKQGVEALSLATPRDTGLTANSWRYDIVRTKDSVSIVWKNTNIQNGVPIAIILQYGHGTRNGGYVEGIDYINPAMEPIFQKIADEMWKEVTRK